MIYVIIKRTVIVVAIFVSLLAEFGPLAFCETQDQYLGFQFVSGKNCTSDGMPKKFCEISKPKAWTANELREMKQSLDAIFPPGKLDQFKHNIQAGGFIKIYRYTDGVAPLGASFISRAAWFWVDPSDRSINAADLGVLSPDVADPHGGFPSFNNLVLLHELAHAYQSVNPELDQPFIRVAKYQTPHGKWEVENGPYWRDVKDQVTEARKLFLEGRTQEALRLSRNYAVPYGYPTAYAMFHPIEGFAEIVAYTYFDQTAPKYMDPNLVRWVRQNVLK